MTLTKLDGNLLSQMIIFGATHLSNHAKMIDALNVFPVPDGDTGTNMNLSMTSGAKEVKSHPSAHAGQVAVSLAKGLLMGARGNSGVILSQLFRGFSKAIAEFEAINTKQLASAFENGVETAYKAVMKPVEGTILTVAKEAAKKAASLAKRQDDIVIVMEETLKAAKEALAKTPEFLPVLKEVGVVDSGGQGLVTIYEGFVAVLKGEALPETTEQPSMEKMVQAEHHRHAQTQLSTESIKYGYCTEFMVKFEAEKLAKSPFNEEEFRNKLSGLGDSLLVVNDDELVKVHVHAEYPGEVLSYAQRFGSLINMKIENMREQHTHILQEAKVAFEEQQPKQETAKELAPYGIVTVGLGKGIVELFKSVGATHVIEAGQTMNPSTEDIVKAVQDVHAKVVYVLPNNKNIIMAANQASELVEDCEVIVIPSKTIPQGMMAMLAFSPESSKDENKEEMFEALSHVKSGQVTYAVRDTSIDGINIKKGQFMGLLEGKIVATDAAKNEATKQLLEKMITETDEILTIIYGEDVTNEELTQLTEMIEQSFGDIELEVHEGDQPLYSYILSVE